MKTREISSYVGFMLGVLLLCNATVGQSEDISIGGPKDRADRLVTIAGQRETDLVAEYSVDAGATWNPATIYKGTTVDEWLPCSYEPWNRGTIEGRIPAGEQACLWNYFFDVAMPADKVVLRLKRPKTGEVVLEKAVDLRSTADTFVIDRRNFARLAGGKLPAPWTLKAGEKKKPAEESLFCSVKDPFSPPLVLKPKLKGWHRIYVGMEPYTNFRFQLSNQGAVFCVPTPNISKSAAKKKLMQEIYLQSADLSGEDVCLAMGGAKKHWKDVSIRYIRFVPMTDKEVAHFHEVRELARSKGRPFAGYMETCTEAYVNNGKPLKLREQIRGEMRLNKLRGCRDVYMHVIRIGCKAWYHSDVVERFMPTEDEVVGADSPGEEVMGKSWANFTNWMKQGDPMAVGIEEARAVGIKVFADLGMNSNYYDCDKHYMILTERFVKENPQYVCRKIYFDYRHPQVRDYVVSIVAELLNKYDLDGVNLDYARWGCRDSFDKASLVDVAKRVHKARQAAEKKWGHAITISTRIPAYNYGEDGNQKNYGGDHQCFVDALAVWAENGWVDRVMTCQEWKYIRDKVDGSSLERYVQAIAGSKVELWGDLRGLMRGQPSTPYLDTARKWVREGLNGGFFIYLRYRPVELEPIHWQLQLIDFPNVTVGAGDR